MYDYNIYMLKLYFESNWDVLLNIKFYFIFIKTDLKKFCLLWGGYGKNCFGVRIT